MIEQTVAIERMTSFSPSAADAVRHLTSQLTKEHGLLTDEDIQAMIQSPMHFLFLAREVKTQHIVGMVTLLVYRIPVSKKAYLEDLVVDSNFRKLGIGTLLLQKAIACAKEEKAAYLDFTSRPSREAANALYQKLGFTKRETNVYRLVIDYAEH